LIFVSMPVSVSIQLLSPHASLPTYATGGSAGMDLSAAIEHPVVLAAGQRATIPCGFAIALPPGYEAQVRPRSGLAAKYGVTVLNTPGTIDADYRGEVKVILINHAVESFTVTPGMRIAQMVVAAVETVSWEPTSELPDTSRGQGGFGHTGT
jgi:dUTP pyrophosphatase